MCSQVFPQYPTKLVAYKSTLLTPHTVKQGEPLFHVTQRVRKRLQAVRDKLWELINTPTKNTAAAPTKFSHRYEMEVVEATVNTVAIPPTRPQNAPAGVARLTPIARMNTPSNDP